MVAILSRPQCVNVINSDQRTTGCSSRITVVTVGPDTIFIYLIKFLSVKIVIVCFKVVLTRSKIDHTNKTLQLYVNKSRLQRQMNALLYML